MTQHWTEASIPDLTSRTYLVTGANSGLGWETARALAQHGARVLVGARNEAKAAEAIDRIGSAGGVTGQLAAFVAELSDLDDLRAAAARVVAQEDRLDGLVNNAGIMFTPPGTTAQGFERQFGVNHLAPFVLTGQLLPLLLSTDGSRVVAVSSFGHRPGRMNFADLNGEQDYNPQRAYFQSKLANLLFTSELQRRLAAAGESTIAVAAHPGGSNTNLGHENSGGLMGLLMRASRPLTPLFAQSAAMGALPQLRATVDPSTAGDDYYGPGGFRELRGHPVLVDRSDRAKDKAAATRLWEASVELTGEEYRALT